MPVPEQKKEPVAASKSTPEDIFTYQMIQLKGADMYPRYVGKAITLCRALFLAVVMSMLAASLWARTKPALTVVSESSYPAGARHFVVHSALVGHDFDVVVSPPPVFGSWVSADLKAAGSRQRAQKFPAIYALDAGYGIAGPMAQMMAGVAAMSPAYVVSVGYRDGQYQWRDTDLLYRSTTQGGVTYGGGGARFLAFLTEELRPFLEAKYPLDPAKAILFGHSFGGLFAANVLAQSPAAFDGYVIGSPSVWMDPQVLSKLAGATPGDGRQVFLAAGDGEEPRMLAGVGRLRTILAAAPSSFKVETKIFPGEDHISYYPLLVQASFRWLAPPPGAERTAIALPLRELQRIVGTYELADGRVVTVSLKSGKAFVRVTGTPGQSELLAETPQRFFLPGGYNVLMTFAGAMDVPASSLIVDMNGTRLRARRQLQQASQP